MSTSNLLFILSIPLYLWVIVAVAREIFYECPPKPKLVMGLGSLAAIFHVIASVMQMHSFEGTDFSLLKSLSLILAVTTLLIAIGSSRRPTRPLLLAAAPLAVIFALAGTLLPATASPLQLEAGEVAHIILSILAFGIFTVATAEALLLNFVSGRLKIHRVNVAMKHMPPVEALEKLMFDLIRTGTVLLALAIVTGLVFLQSFAEQHLYHKFFFSILGLIIYAWLLWGHQRYGWRGRKALHWTLGGFFCLLLAYAGSKIVLELLL